MTDEIQVQQETVSEPTIITEENPVIESEVTEEKQEAEHQEEQQEAPKKDNSVQKRFDELTRKSREAEREAAFWRERALGSNKPETQLEEPKIEDFEDAKDYIKAAAKYAIQEEKKAEAAERSREAEAKVLEAKSNSWAERQSSVRESISDYDEVVSGADLPVSNHVRDALLDSEKGPELVYHFAKNPDVLDRLNSLPERQAAMEIGRLEARLTTPEAAPKPISNAPPPIKPVGSGRTNASRDPEQMSPGELKTWMKNNGSRWVR